MTAAGSIPESVMSVNTACAVFFLSSSGDARGLWSGGSIGAIVAQFYQDGRIGRSPFRVRAHSSRDHSTFTETQIVGILQNAESGIRGAITAAHTARRSCAPSDWAQRYARVRRQEGQRGGVPASTLADHRGVTSVHRPCLVPGVKSSLRTSVTWPLCIRPSTIS